MTGRAVLRRCCCCKVATATFEVDHDDSGPRLAAGVSPATVLPLFRLYRAGCHGRCREHRIKPSLELSHALSERRDRVAWSIKVTEEYAAWFTALIKEDLASATQVAQAVAALREEGPALGRPLVDRIQGSKVHHLKELRPGSAGRSEIRVLFAFDPTRSALLLLGGDKAGNWQRWYRQNIPIAERLYLEYTTEQEE